jgi:hypothetical protein
MTIPRMTMIAAGQFAGLTNVLIWSRGLVSMSRIATGQYELVMPTEVRDTDILLPTTMDGSSGITWTQDFVSSGTSHFLYSRRWDGAQFADVNCNFWFQVWRLED